MKLIVLFLVFIASSFTHFAESSENTELSIYVLAHKALDLGEKCGVLSDKNLSDLKMGIKVIQINLIKSEVDLERVREVDEKLKNRSKPNSAECVKNETSMLATIYYKVAINTAIQIASGDKGKQKKADFDLYSSYWVEIDRAEAPINEASDADNIIDEIIDSLFRSPSFKKYKDFFSDKKELTDSDFNGHLKAISDRYGKFVSCPKKPPVYILKTVSWSHTNRLWRWENSCAFEKNDVEIKIEFIRSGSKWKVTQANVRSYD